jgi:hypothetical protein
MGIDDRDYMRSRYRQRQGQSAGTTWWNDRKGRRELRDDDKAVPLGSASWIGGGGNGSGDGGWFDAANRSFDYQKNRHRPTRRGRSQPAQRWIFLLCALPILIPAYREAKRSGWIPDRAAELPFPASGTVTVNSSVNPKTATVQIQVTAAQANAVVQLFDRRTDAHVISVYIKRNEDVSVPVPPGTYRMKIIEGDKWHGLTNWFGSSTTYETVVRPMIFAHRSIQTIDLHRSLAGNLHTSINITNPKPLN